MSLIKAILLFLLIIYKRFSRRRSQTTSILIKGSVHFKIRSRVFQRKGGGAHGHPTTGCQA